MVLLKLLIICLLKGYAFSATLSYNPDYLFHGTELTLTCNVSRSIENGTVTFYRNSNILGIINYYNDECLNLDSAVCKKNCSCNVGTRQMILKYTPNSTPSASEIFRCYFTDGSSPESSNSITIEPAVIPNSATIAPSTTSYTVREGDNLNTITCSATCLPACTFSWIYPNGITKDSATISFTNIQRSESGKYHCKAVNVVGTIQSPNISITVHYGPSDLQISPTSTQYTKTQGDYLSISCSATCLPTCTIYWTYPNYTVHSDGHLNIYSLQKSHDGYFICTANNTISKNSKTVSVTVNYSPENVHLTPSSTSYTIIEYERLQVSCTATCRPICNYTWNGPSFSSSGHQLLIPSVNRTQSGIYTCRASNTLEGINSPNLSLVVHTRPTRVEKLNVICTGAEAASVGWIPDLTVVPEQNFSVHYVPKNGGRNMNMSFHDSIDQQLYIQHVYNLNPSTEYNFTVSSENYLGRTYSKSVSCTTAERNEESSTNAAFVAGIVLISLALLLIIIVIAFLLLQRYRKMLGIGRFPCSCNNCFDSCLLKTSRKKSKPYENTQQREYENYKGSQGVDNGAVVPDNEKESKPYENTQHRNYENYKGSQGIDNGAVVLDNNDESYELFKRKSTQRNYTQLHLANTGSHNDLNEVNMKIESDYENIKSKKNNKKVKPNILPKPGKEKAQLPVGAKPPKKSRLLT